MRLSRINIPVLSLVLVAFLSILSGQGACGAGDSYFDRQLDTQIEQLLEEPDAPSAVLKLYTIDSVKFMVAWDGRVERTYRSIIDNPEAPPELKAHALWFLAKLDIKAGRLGDAEQKVERLGFVTDWAVIGPFDNEGKSGFDAEYPPEKELDLKAEYKGKERKVAWREYPPIARFGFINFGAIFVPNTDVAAYALTFIHSDKEQDVAFRFGSDDAIKIWFDDVLLYSDDGHHAGAFDQVSAGVMLHKGWNKVLVKVTQGDGGWGLMFRVTGPDGSPVEGIRTQADVASVPGLAGACTRREKIEEVEVYDVVRELRQIAEKQPNNARAQSNLGVILNKKHAFDADDEEDLKAFERALELNPKNKAHYMRLAMLYPDKNKSRRAWEKVVELYPGYAPAWYKLGSYYSRSGFPRKAYKYYAKSIAANSTYYPAHLALARHYDRYGNPGGAARIMSRLERKFSRVPHLLHYTISFTPALVEDDELLRRCQRYLGLDYANVSTRRTMISIYKRRGDMEKVLEQLEIIYDLDRSSDKTLREMANYYTGTMDFDRAREYIGKILAIRPEDPGAHTLAGNISHWRDEDDPAFASWARSLEIRPQNRNLREYLEHLRPKEKPFEDKYKVEVADLLGKFNPSPSDYPEDSSVFLLDQSVYEVHPNGLYNRFGQQVIKILQKKGAEDFKYRYVRFSPGRDEVDVQAAKIYKLDDEGNIIRTVNAGGPFNQSLSGTRSKLYYNVQAHVHFFNNLEVGDVIEYTYRVNQVAARNLYADYFGNLAYIRGGQPIKEKRVTYITPAEKDFYYNAVGIEKPPEITEEDGRRTYTWALKDLSKIKAEPKMPGFSELTPYIHISTFKDWKSVCDWYWGLIQDQFVLDQQAKDTTAEVIEGAETTLDKVRAIHNYVVQNTRYIGLEFGIHGHKPYKAYQIFSRKYGDCKDKATLMISMLKEAGVESDIVVLRTRGRGNIDPYPASLAVFDHAICYIPELDLYLDGTAEYSGTGELPWADRGMPVLLVSETKREFTLTPVRGPEENIISDVYRVTVDAEGGVTIEGTRDMTGQYCSFYRRAYQEEETRKDSLEKSWRATVPSAELLEFEFSDLKDLEQSVKYSYKVKAPKYATRSNDGSMTFKGFFGGYNLTKIYAGLSERKHDLVIDYPWTSEKTLKYELPEGFRVAEVPEDFHNENDFAECHIVYEKADGAVTVKMKFVMKANRIDVDQYAKFREFCQLVDEKQNEKIRISR